MSQQSLAFIQFFLLCPSLYTNIILQIIIVFYYLQNILSNGRYKSVLHGDAMNNKATRIPLATAEGPSWTVVESAP